MVHRNDDSFRIPNEILEDCFARFFMVEDDRPYYDRIYFCTYLEQAYWFYTDSWVDNDKKLKNVSYTCFVQQIVDNIDVDIPDGGTVQQLVTEFTSFKYRVGTYGAILVDPTLTKVLLVQSFNGQSWGFPKGKIEETETLLSCATREVREEINYDISHYVNPELYLDAKLSEQSTRLYLIFGVPESTEFKTNTRKEIAEIKWFELSMLPTHRGDKRPLVNTGYSPNNFFVILPFVKRLREEVRTMEMRCIEMFRAPIYKQNFHMKFLQRYYPRVYKIRAERERKLKIEAEKVKVHDPKYFCEKTLKQLMEEEKKKMENQKNLSNVLTMLKNATLRQEDLKKRNLEANATTSDGAADSDPQKFRFKSHLLARPDNGTPGIENITDLSSPLLGSTVPSLLGSTAPSLLGSTAPSLLGSTAPSLLGSTAPSLLGSTAPSLLGSTAPSLLGSAAPSLLSGAAPSLLGSAAPALLGSNAPPSLLSSAAPSLLGSAASSLLGSATPSLLGNATSSLLCSAAPSHLGSNAPPLLGSTAPPLGSTVPPLLNSTATAKHSPSKKSRTAALESVFPEVPLQRSKTWDNAKLDFSDVMNAVEVAWRASYASHNTDSTAAGAKRKHRGKENRIHLW